MQDRELMAIVLTAAFRRGNLLSERVEVDVDGHVALQIPRRVLSLRWEKA